MTAETTQRRLAEFLKSALDCSWEGSHFDGADIQDTAQKLGLIVAEKYDPAVHGKSAEAMPGDQWFAIAPDVKELLLPSSTENPRG